MLTDAEKEQVRQLLAYRIGTDTAKSIMEEMSSKTDDEVRAELTEWNNNRKAGIQSEIDRLTAELEAIGPENTGNPEQTEGIPQEAEDAATRG